MHRASWVKRIVRDRFRFLCESGQKHLVYLSKHQNFLFWEFRPNYIGCLKFSFLSGYVISFLRIDYGMIINCKPFALVSDFWNLCCALVKPVKPHYCYKAWIKITFCLSSLAWRLNHSIMVVIVLHLTLKPHNAWSLCTLSVEEFVN